MAHLDYHVFRKSKKLKNGTTVRRWYYYYTDADGRQTQRSCGAQIKCRKAAEDFISCLPPVQRQDGVPLSGQACLYSKPDKAVNQNLLVRDIAENMFFPNSPHVQRRRQLKKSVSTEALTIGRLFMNHIISVWGNRPLRSLELDEIMNYLFSVERSGSWKNSYIGALAEIYQEGQFLGCKVYKPNFPKIGREQNKADIFSEAELALFFKPENFSHDFYLFFLCSLSGGFRLGEVRALRVKQIIFDKKAVIIDGFLKEDNKIRTIYNKCGSPEHPKLRVVPFPELPLALLKDHIERKAAGDEDYVFTYKDRPISKSMAERAFIGAMVNAGITWEKETLISKGYWRHGHVQIKRDLIPDGRKLIPHSLRYTYITRMSRDMDAHNLLKLTGHGSTVMVDYYNRKNLEMALEGIPSVDLAISTLLPQAISKAG